MGCPEKQTADKSASARAERDGSANYKNQIKHLILSWDPQKYTAENLRAQAEKFSKEKFKEQICKFINNYLMKANLKV